jgi:hypothetical protein
MLLAPDVDPREIAERHGHEYIGTVGDLHNVHWFKKLPETVHGVTHPHHEVNGTFYTLSKL